MSRFSVNRKELRRQFEAGSFPKPLHITSHTRLWRQEDLNQHAASIGAPVLELVFVSGLTEAAIRASAKRKGTQA